MRIRQLLHRLILFASLAVIALAFLYPFEITTVPSWRFQVIDQRGNPIAYASGRQVWQYYPIEKYSHEEGFNTNADGYVTLPERTLKANLIQQIIGMGYNLTVTKEDGKARSYIKELAGAETINDGGYSGSRLLPKQVTVWHISRPEY